jgi:DNA processing protein
MQKSSKETFTITGTDLPRKIPELAQVPELLYSKGDQSLLTEKRGAIVGIVGARKTTAYGREVTNDIARKLAQAGVTVVSGLALGVDSIAHRACVENNSPTIAVLPCGIETVYPAAHKNLAQQILEKGGALISEYLGSTLPAKWQFIERNRLIAALSDILIIPEAAEKSGSLHTARFALELGVTIMAVPGPINSPYSTGTNRLIQSGAIPLLDPQDVLDELGIKPVDVPAYLPENEIEAKILEHISTSSTPSDELLRATGLDAPIFQTHLTMLEIKGVIQASSGCWKIR